MEVELQHAYEEACRALGEAMVQNRLLLAEVDRLQTELANRE